MRDAGDVRVERDRHDARIALALGVEDVELRFASGVELVRGLSLDRRDHDVVHIDGIGDGDDLASGLEHELERKIIGRPPIAAILQAASAKCSSVRAVSTRPGPSQPRGRTPVLRSSVSSVFAITSASSGTAAIVFCTKPCPIISQPAANVRSTMIGYEFTTSALTLSVAFAPNFSRTSRKRHMPTRFPY